MNQKAKSTLEKYKNILKLRNYSDKTINCYSHYLEQFLLSQNKPALHLTFRDIKYYLENKEYSSISVQNQIYSSLKLFCKHILKIKFYNNIFLERPRKEKKLPRVIDQCKLKDKILSIKNKKHKAIIALAFSVGLRVSEIINLKCRDIDRHRMIIHIRNAKGNKDRFVKLTSNILRILEDYARGYKPKIYLFNGQFLSQYSVTSCQNIYKKYIDKETSFHNLRHSGATAMLENGTDIKIIQSILGHKSSKSTEIYLHISNNIIQKANCPI